MSSVGIESIEFTEQSRQLVQQFASNKMNVAAYEGVSSKLAIWLPSSALRKASKTTALAMVACCWAWMLAQAINPMTDAPVQAPAPAPAPEAAAPASHTASMSVEEQVEAMKKLKELVDIGVALPRRI